MNRRNFTKLGVVGMTALAGRKISAAPKSDQPNVLIIKTDEHSFRTLGCYRKLMTNDQAFVWGEGVEVKTPNLDRIANEGAICTSYYSACPVCTPARASFVTGLYPVHTGAPQNDMPMLNSVETFATVLQKEGYATSYVGKWHLDGQAKPGFAPARKFGFADNRYMINRGHWKAIEHDENGKPFIPNLSDDNDRQMVNVATTTDENYTTDFLTNRALEIIERDKNQPFCLFLSIPDPHDPNSVRAPYNKMFADVKFKDPKTMSEALLDKPYWALGRQEKELSQKHMQDYFGMVRCIDDNIGRVLDYLDENGLAENTIVVFTADHGDLLYEHNRRNKGVPYEASVKIPFIIRWPAKIPAGKIIEKAYNGSDFAPTLLSMMGASKLKKFHGRDDAKSFVSNEKVVKSDELTYVSGPSGAWAGAFNSRYKFILTARDIPWLFDLEVDPDETKNFATDPKYAKIANEMQSWLKVQINKFEDPVLKNKIIYLGDPRPAAPAELKKALAAAPKKKAPAKKGKK